MGQHAVFLVLLLAVLTKAENPGLKARVSQAGLNYAASVAVDILSTKIQRVQLPDKTGSADVTVGKVNYEFTQMKITGFKKPDTSLTVKTGSGLTWSFSGAGISMHGNWHYKYRLGFITVSDSGNFDVDLSGVSGSISVTLGVSQTGTPTIRSTDCSCHINSLSIHLHGGASWLYDLFVGFIENPLRDQVQSQVCEQARKAIDENAAGELATLKVQVIIDQQWLLDYRLVSGPIFGSGFLESNHKGEFFFVKQQTEAPFQPPALPSPATTDRMLTFWVSDYVLNTAGYVLHKQNILHYNLTRNDLPESDKVYLNTTCCATCQCIGKILPAIAQSYPNAFVEAQMLTTEAPSVKISATQVTGNFSGVIDLWARLSNGSIAHVFKTKIVASVVITPTFDGSVIRATVQRIDETISIVDSSIGPVSSSILKFFFDYVKKAFIIPKLNEVGSRGFPIPNIEHIHFANVGLQLMPNCVMLQTDVQYKGQTLYFEPRF